MSLFLTDIEWPNLRDRMSCGTPRQRQAVAALDALAIFDRLAFFAPMLAGTIPLDIDIAGSDLDVISHAVDLNAFAAACATHYARHDGFTSHVDLERSRQRACEPPRSRSLA